MVYMPRIDLWAIETCHQVGEDNCVSSKSVGLSDADDLKSLDPISRASDLWMSFVEQAESIFISSSLMIVATTEVPFELLPLRITDFFGKNKQNLSSSNYIGSTVPRFSVHVEGNFDRDMVIGSSATKLSNDVARYFVELIHQKTHIQESSFNKSYGNVEADVDTVRPNLDSDLAIEYRSKLQTSTPPPNKKEEKGKSNLLSAISTFGYQILQYPHFAELCWVTSKLKEGPSAEIDGPWKSWPFNSCIIRPNDSSGNVKSKEKHGIVRGLIAVGLSAYRGVYSSLREVSAAVREVLEILTSLINAKVEGGKDRYQFVHLLSQVAYLEDMVNSWAYTLQSFEAPHQPIKSMPKLYENKTTKDAVFEGDNCMDKPLHLEHEKENTVEDEYTNQLVSVINESNHIIETQGSTSFKDQADTHTHAVNGTNGVLECSEIKFMEHSNGFACEESVAIQNDGPSSSAEKFDANDNSVDKNTNVDLSADQAAKSPVTLPGVCLYHFCSKCMFSLQHVMQRIMVSQWNKSSTWTTEDVHDTVTSLSSNLYTAVREFCQSESPDNIRTFFENCEVGTCECEVSGNKVTTGMECCCHSESGSTTGHGLDSEIIFKNGVVTVLDPETDVSFHCKFQTLCLCSLIEYIVMTKQPSG